VEPAFSWGIRYRNRRYDQEKARVARVPVPVISVGNLTAGGTGKTPLVASIAKWLVDRGRRVVLVSRGYGARSGTPNDEALELAARLPDVPHLQDPDRVAAARRAVDELRADVILLDDAFQHRRLHRDLDLVLIDALEPFGYGHLLPRGLLREPLSSLQRADVIVLSRADLVTSAERDAIRRRIQEHAPRILCVETAHQPIALLDKAGNTLDPSTLFEQRVAAFCGLGNPRAFRQTLERCGAKIIDFLAFSDHFSYRQRDTAALDRWAAQFDVEQVLCTMKDFVKLHPAQFGGRPLRALMIGVEFLDERDAFELRLAETIASTAP
jgi:tetraacyldisaccharide 4'-kinase